jgi:protein-L-isoaspartate O-methyltransferase
MVRAVPRAGPPPRGSDGGGTPEAYFAGLYAASDDPWHLAERWYERRKYALTLAMLGRPRYRRAFEPGCSVGVLTALLAERCDELLAADRVEKATVLARARLRGRANVNVVRWALPEWPAGPFDLVVLSEVGYYFDAGVWRGIVDAAVESLEPDGELVAVHWRHPVAEHRQRGDEVHQTMADHPSLQRLARHEEVDVLLDLYGRRPLAAGSVADREGLLDRPGSPEQHEPEHPDGRDRHREEQLDDDGDPDRLQR